MITRLITWCRPYASYLLAGWLVAVITVSSIPSLPTLKIHTAHNVIRLDYFIHFCEYGFMAFLTFMAFSGRSFYISYKRWIVLTGGLILFALLDELHQKLIPGRTYNIKDFLSNATGIIAAMVFCISVFKTIRHKANT